MGYSPWGRKESDTTELTSLSCLTFTLYVSSEFPRNLSLSCHMHQLLFCLKHHDTNFMLLWPSSVDTGFSQRLSNLEKLSKFLQNFQPTQLYYEQRKQSHL